MRQFIRHPADIPINIKLIDNPSLNPANDTDTQECRGLCFIAGCPIEKGLYIHIEIPISTPSFETDGRVVWCKENAMGYNVGVQIEDKRAKYNLRMIEQVCYIEHYRRDMLAKEGRLLTSEEAAREWIPRYAASFPN